MSALADELRDFTAFIARLSPDDLTAPEREALVSLLVELRELEATFHTRTFHVAR